MKHRHGISVKECLAIGASILFVALGCLVMWGGLYVEIDPSRACYVNDEPVDNELECKNKYECRKPVVCFDAYDISIDV
jgi:hypothetical protein